MATVELRVPYSAPILCPAVRDILYERDTETFIVHLKDGGEARFTSIEEMTRYTDLLYILHE